MSIERFKELKELFIRKRNKAPYQSYYNSVIDIYDKEIKKLEKSNRKI